MDCLVTKLKANVTDSTLPKLGELTFPIEANGSCSFRLSGGNSVDMYVDVLGDGVGTVNNVAVSFPYNFKGTTTILNITSVAGCTVVVKNKYDITLVRYVNASLYLTDLLFSPLEELGIYRVNRCTLAEVNKFSNCEKISLAPPNNSSTRFLSGAITDLFPNGNTKLKELTINRSLVTGSSIESLGNLTALTSLTLQNNASLSGDIDDVLDAMVTNGRTSGAITLNFNGSITSTSGITSGSTVTFSSGETRGWAVNE